MDIDVALARLAKFGLRSNDRRPEQVVGEHRATSAHDGMGWKLLSNPQNDFRVGSDIDHHAAKVWSL